MSIPLLSFTGNTNYEENPQSPPSCGQDNVNWSDGRGDVDGPFINPDVVIAVEIRCDPGNSFNVYWNDQFIGIVEYTLAERNGSVFLGSNQNGLLFDSYCNSLPVDTGSGEDDPFCASLPSYSFESSLINKGCNTIRLDNFDGEPNPTGEIDVKVFQKSGLQLVSPANIIATGFSLGVGQDSFSFCCPIVERFPTGLSYLYEFDPTFTVDTGNLNVVYSGSGVHSNRDVTFTFDMLDQKATTISSDIQYVENPLLGNMSFDIVDRCGNVVAENYFSGKYNRSVTISALENENIFGSYQKDFGVRVRLPNSFDGSTFTGVFYAFGNIPNIIDVRPDFSEFSGAAKATERIDLSVRLQNNLQFTRMDRYDIYAFPESGVVLSSTTSRNPKQQSGYLLTQTAVNTTDAYLIRLTRQSLPYDIPHFFTIVPYSTMGSGKPYSFGPITFVTPEENFDFDSTSTSQLNLFYGNKKSNNIFQTGSISSSGLLHTFDTGIYTTAQYLIEMKCSDGVRRSSKLVGIANPDSLPPDDLYLFEDVLNNTGVSAVSYSLTGTTGTSVGLYVSGVGGLGSYKFQATLI
jgi:hypothetical protein